MPNPPSPGLPPALLQLLARLVWVQSPSVTDASGLPLGLFGTTDPTASKTGLYLDAGETWGAYAATLRGLGPFLVTEATAHLIQQGELASDGALVSGGQRYRVQALTELDHNIARAIAVA